MRLHLQRFPRAARPFAFVGSVGIWIQCTSPAALAQVSPGPGQRTSPPSAEKAPAAPPASGAKPGESEAPAKDGEKKEVVPLVGYPDDPKIALAQRLLQGGNYEYAKNILTQILASRPDVGRAEFFLGVALAKMKKYEDARPHLERSIQFHQPFPEAKHAHHFMGWASYHLGELGRAKSDFEAHLAEVPNEPDSTFALGLIAFDEDRLDEAEAKFKKAIELQQGPKANRRDVAKAWIRLGDVAQRQDKLADAETRYMEGLALFADHYEGWAKLARVRDQMGKAKEAESARNEELRARERVGRLELEAQNPPQPASPDEKPSEPAPVKPGETPASKPTEPPPATPPAR